MKRLTFAVCALSAMASLAHAAPAAKTVAKAPAKVAVKAPVATKTGAVKTVAPKNAPTKVAQAPPMAKADAALGFFPDVPRNHWAFAAVQRLAVAGIVEGYPAPPTAVAPVAKADEAKTKVAAAPVETAKADETKKAE